MSVLSAGGVTGPASDSTEGADFGGCQGDRADERALLRRPSATCCGGHSWKARRSPTGGNVRVCWRRLTSLSPVSTQRPSKPSSKPRASKSRMSTLLGFTVRRGLVLTVDRGAGFRLSRRASAQRFAYYFPKDNRNPEATERWGSGAALARGARFDFRFFFKNAAQNPGSNSR